MATLVQKRKRDALEEQTSRPAPAIHADYDEHPYDDETTLDANSLFDQAFGSTEPTTAIAETEHALPAEEEEEVADEEIPPPQQEATPTAPASASDTAAAAMAQYHTMTVPQSTEQSFMSGQQKDGAQEDGSAELGREGVQRTVTITGSFGDFQAEPATQTHHQAGSPNGNGGDAGSPGGGKDASSMTPGRGSGSKPPVGTEEWHKIRKDNHKEVERRRRETINEGITLLSSIVPGCEKNKGSILSRAVQFITQLKENETQNIEKWTLEKLLTEQAIAELSGTVDRLKGECTRAWGEVEVWKRRAGAVEGVKGGGEGDAEGEEVD